MLWTPIVKDFQDADGIVRAIDIKCSRDTKPGWLHLSFALGAALSLEISCTTAAPRSMKAPAVALEGSSTTRGFPPDRGEVQISEKAENHMNKCGPEGS